MVHRCGAGEAGQYAARADVSMRILCQNGVLQQTQQQNAPKYSEKYTWRFVETKVSQTRPGIIYTVVMFKLEWMINAVMS